MEKDFNYYERYQKRIEEEVALVKEKRMLEEQEKILKQKMKRKAALHITLELIGFCGIIIAIVGVDLDSLIMKIIGGIIAGGFLGTSAVILAIDYFKGEKAKIGGGKLLEGQNPVKGVFVILTFIIMIGGFAMMFIGEKEDTVTIINGIRYVNENRTDIFYYGVGLVCGSLGVFLLIAIIPIIFLKLFGGIGHKNKTVFETQSIDAEAMVIFVRRAMEVNGNIYNNVGLEFNDGRKVTLFVDGHSYKKDAVLKVKYLPNKYKKCIIVDCEQNYEQEMAPEYQC